MSSGVSRVGRSGWKRVCSFCRIILPPRFGRAYKESAGIFSRLKFMVRIRERRYAGLPPCIRLIYSTSETVDEPHAKPPSGARERRLGRTIHGRTAVNQEGKKSEGSKKESTGFVSTRFDRRREKGRERISSLFFGKKNSVVDEFLNICPFCLHRWQACKDNTFESANRNWNRKVSLAE